ncbi:hypothetical protein [Actinoplanes sp. NPDC023714]|uniref:hypothetical protein n=1 Tax=Actinoplanes sp. NPDC023714 TaxID=3154322 RepID=UPI00340EE7C8
MVTPAGGRVGGGALKTGGRFKTRRARLLLAFTAGIMGLLCLGGAVIIFLLYDDATEIKRTEPAAVVDNFLGAYFADRNNEEARLYICSSGSSLSSLEDFRRTLFDQESRTGGTIMVGWKELSIATPGEDSRTATVTITVDSMVDNRPIGKSEHRWRLSLIDDGGWRVCGAERF